MRPLFSFLFVLFMIVSVQNSIAQFTGDFDHGNWLTSVSDGTVNGTENQLTLVGAEGDNGSIQYSINVNSDLLISFDWGFSSTDEAAFYDPAFYTIDGEFFQLTDDGGDLSQTGSISVLIPQGAVFGFGQSSDGCCGVGTLLITNFAYEAAPSPGGGALCDQAEAVIENTLTVATGSLTGAWYSFSIPDEPNKKLEFSLPSNVSAEVYRGGCFDSYLIDQFTGSSSVYGVFAGETVLIALYNDIDFAWTFSVDDILPGEACGSAFSAATGTNNASLAPQWFTFTIPQTGDLTISSVGFTDTDTYLRVYDGCGGNQLASSDDFSNLLQSQITLQNVAGGTTIKILWDDQFSTEPFSWSLELSDITQVITFDPLGPKSILDPPFDLVATSSSNLPVTFSSQNTDVATVNGNSITIVGVGTTDITASQEGNATYNPATPVVRTLVVTKADQLITFNSLSAKTVIDPDFEITASSSSGSPVSFSSSDPSIATVQGNVITIVGIGSTDITASQEGNATYNPATPVVRTLVVTKADQMITFNSLSAKTVIDPDFEITATSSSGLPVSFSSSDPSIATVQGNVITIVGIGSTDIAASQEGNATYNPATPAVRTLVVTKADQTITFNSLSAKTAIDPDFEVTASSSSGLPVSFSSSDPSIATVQGNVITIVGIGSTDIAASQSGNATYNPATQVVRTLVVAKASQTITFNELLPKSVGDLDFELNVFSTSNLLVTITSSNESVATINGAIVSIVGAGSAIIKAEQNGNEIYLAAPAVERTLIVKANQAITFDVLPSKTFGDAPFELSASASSGLPVTFESSNPDIARVNGTSVTILHAGTVTITATQSGNDMHNASPPVGRTLVINKAAQQITFGGISAKTIGDAAFQLSASSTSSLPVSLSSSDVTLAQLSGATINLLKAGSVTITATQSGNNDFLAATPVTQKFCINPAKPSISANFNNDGAPVLTSSNSSGNQWYRNGQPIGGSTSVSHTVTLAGDYSVVTTASTCVSATSEAFTVVITDIADRETDVNVYPNPASDHLIVEGTEEHSVFEAVGVSGSSFKVDSHWISSSQHTKVVVSELPPGFYSLLIRQGVKSSRVKFIKK